MEEKEVLSGALAKAELGRVTARAALADLVAAAEPVDANDWPSRNEWDELTFALSRARKVMKEES